MNYVIKFRSEAFDYRGVVPEDSNAGNRFYGADLAAYLADAMQAAGHRAVVIDEDWGWLVEVGESGSESSSDLRIYNGLEGSIGSIDPEKRNEWVVHVVTQARRRILGFGIGWRRIEPDTAICNVANLAIRDKATEIVSAGLEIDPD